jgi:hypothetical protein
LYMAMRSGMDAKRASTTASIQNANRKRRKEAYSNAASSRAG